MTVLTNKLLMDAQLACIEKEIAEVEDEKARMEVEIHRKMAFLSNLRAKRNTLLPVFRLPPETLSIIFLHGARDYHESDPVCQSTPDSIPSWVNVSYVCHHWRNVALNCPTLWTYHFDVSLRWTEELLLRSKQVPLKISLVYAYPYLKPDSRWLRLVEKLLIHVDRTRDLRLHLPTTLFPTTSSLRAPRLENLEIRLFHPPSLPFRITDGDTPALCTLKLVNCPLPWYSLNLNRLSKLSLHHAPFHMDMGAFLAMLNGLQDLTLLDLAFVLPSARGFLSGSGLGRSPKLELSRLTLLSVVAPLSSVVALLSSVNIPLRAQICLEPQFEPGCSVDDYAPISSFLAQRFSTSENPSLPIFHSLILDSGFVPTLTLSVSERDSDIRSPTNEPGPNIPLRIGLRGDETGEMDDLIPIEKHCIINDICHSLPLADVQSLHVIEPYVMPDFWENLLGRLDGLRRMMLSLGRMPDLSMLTLTNDEDENLDGQTTDSQDSTSGHVLVPALEELELRGVSFSSEDEPFPWRGMTQESFFGMLSTRKGLRDRLKMTQCGVEPYL